MEHKGTKTIETLDKLEFEEMIIWSIKERKQ